MINHRSRNYTATLLITLGAIGGGIGYYNNEVPRNSAFAGNCSPNELECKIPPTLNVVLGILAGASIAFVPDYNRIRRRLYVVK